MAFSLIARTINMSGSRDQWARFAKRLYPDGVLFFHIPKCGGTSFSHPLRLKYALSQLRISEEASRDACSDLAIDDWMGMKQRLMHYHASMGVRFVQGHVPYAERLFGQFRASYKFVTVLRSPEDRVISHYFFNSDMNRMTFRDFLDSQMGRIECSVYSRFFGGLAFAARQETGEHVAMAKSVLQSFDLAGILELPDQLASHARKLLGLSFKLPKRNQGRKRMNSGDSISADDRCRLAERCAGDREIYEHFVAINDCVGMATDLRTP